MRETILGGPNVVRKLASAPKNARYNVYEIAEIRRSEYVINLKVRIVYFAELYRFTRCYLYNNCTCRYNYTMVNANVESLSIPRSNFLRRLLKHLE